MLVQLLCSHAATRGGNEREWSRWKIIRLPTSHTAASFPQSGLRCSSPNICASAMEKTLANYQTWRMLQPILLSKKCMQNYSFSPSAVDKLQKFLGFSGYFFFFLSLLKKWTCSFLSLESCLKKFLPKKENTTQLYSSSKCREKSFADNLIDQTSYRWTTLRGSEIYTHHLNSPL